MNDKQKPRFLVDESVDFPVVLFLRNNDYDSASIAEDSPSLEDIKILKQAYEQNRILLTNDKDFGSLIFKEKLKSKGLILFRLKDQSSQAKIEILKYILENYKERLQGNFIVVTKNKIRIRKIPYY